MGGPCLFPCEDVSRAWPMAGALHIWAPFSSPSWEGKYTTLTKAQVFPLLPFLSRKGTDGRNLCPSPSLAALALGKGDAGAEIHPGCTNFSQHLGKRPARVGSRKGQAAEEWGRKKKVYQSLVHDLGIPAQEPRERTRYLSAILQRMDSCTCFKDEKTEAQRREGKPPRSPSW